MRFSREFSRVVPGTNLKSAMNNLETYLNDHLAGATGAVELLEHLSGRSGDEEFKAFCQGLLREVEEDAQGLRLLMERLNVKESSVKKVGGWLAQKVAELKLVAGGEDSSGLGRLQALEILVLGISGKKALWTALQTVKEPAPSGWIGTDLGNLIRRADDQLARTEAERLKAARSALKV